MKKERKKERCIIFKLLTLKITQKKLIVGNPIRDSRGDSFMITREDGAHVHV